MGQLISIQMQQGFPFSDDLFINHVAGYLCRCEGRSSSMASLQDEESSIFHGKFDELEWSFIETRWRIFAQYNVSLPACLDSDVLASAQY